MSAEEDKTPTKPGKETVYVDVEDEITSIIDKVENAKASVVALVLPKRAATLQSIVNMRLLKRAADSAKKEVVLVTSEAALLPLAGAAKLHVAKNLQSKPAIPPTPGMPAEPAPTPAQSEDGTGKVDLSKDKNGVADEDNLPKKISYDKSIGELAAAHEIEHPETIELGEDENAIEEAANKSDRLPKAPRDKALKVPNFDKFRMSLGLGIAALVALIIFIFLALFVLPKATITIDTTTTPVSANLTLNTSDTAKSLDESNSVIPAVLKTSDQTSAQTVNATGQQNNGQKATGKVNFTATECSATLPTSVPSGTGVSSGGLTYITQGTTKFSNTATNNGNGCFTYASTSQTDITAQGGGTKYNVSSANFTVFGRSDVTGTGSASGGTDDIKTVVSQNDLDNAKKTVTSTQTDAYTKTFEKQLSDQGYYVLTSTMKLSDTSATGNPAVGQPASSTTVTLKTTYSVLCVKRDDLTKAIKDAVAGQIDKSKQKVEDSDILAGAQVSIASQTSPTIATLSITESTEAVPIINASDVKKQAAGQKSGDISASLSTIPGVKSVNVKLSPFWVSKVPKSQSKITVVLKRELTKSNGQ